ncbi:MAG TPA: hypothetical protein VG406_15840 [Isosphaeraceae bacterium]|jgi:hypothetical protein|nr:hypothetical protein [Isosphaeraceae bacterium]
MTAPRWTSWPRWLALACVLAPGCVDEEPPPAPIGPQRVRVKLLLETVEGKDKAARDVALGRIEELGRSGLSPKDGTRLLRAAARIGRPDRSGLGARLVAAAAWHARGELLPIVAEVFPKLGDDARLQALNLLGVIGDRRAAEEQLALIREYAPKGGVPGLGAAAWQARPRYADVFFPALFELLDDPRLSADVGSLTAAYLNAGRLRNEDLAAHLDRIERAVRECRAWFLANEDRVDPSRSAQASALILLLGHIPGDRAEAALRGMLDVPAPWVRNPALVELIGRGDAVDSASLEAIADDPEWRAWLFEMLRKIGQSHRFPDRFANQVSLAESELVSWLIEEAESGRPAGIVFERTDPAPAVQLGRPRVAYLFRFRKRDQADWLRGWVVYPRADSLLTGGDAGSDFKPWGDPSPIRFGDGGEAGEDD